MTEPVSGNLETLHSSLTSLISESRSLRTDVHGAEIARNRNALINLGVLGLLLLFTLVLIAITLQTNRLAHEVNNTNLAVADCTTAGGKCYEEGKTRTGQAVGSIRLADIYVAECARLRPGDSGPAFDAFLEKCVNDRLIAAARATPAPSAAPAPSATR